MEYYKYIYLWIGIAKKEEEKYYQYFEIDYSVEDIEDPKYKACQFCKDIGELWYDEDFIIMNTPLEKEVDIETLLELPYSAIDKKEYSKVIKECHKKSIYKANALFDYATSDKEELNIPDKKIKFNDLEYIGCYLHE